MHGFTLVELLIVLVIVWMLTVFSLWISNDQIQKVKNKTVKESILSEWQSRYSRNLWSSSISWTIYKHMDITLSSWSNEIEISYFTWDNDENPFIENSFTNKFIIKNDTTLEYYPYRIACKIKNWEDELDKITLTININNRENADYCFELNSKNCRLIEVHSSKCWIETN